MKNTRAVTNKTTMRELIVLTTTGTTALLSLGSWPGVILVGSQEYWKSLTWTNWPFANEWKLVPMARIVMPLPAVVLPQKDTVLSFAIKIFCIIWLFVRPVGEVPWAAVGPPPVPFTHLVCGSNPDMSSIFSLRSKLKWNIGVLLYSLEVFFLHLVHSHYAASSLVPLAR